VPLAVALPLCALADQYQLASGLARALHMWLAAVLLSLAAYAELLPAAWEACPRMLSHLRARVHEGMLDSLVDEPAFKLWPLGLLIHVLERDCELLGSFEAAAAWATAPGGARERARDWPALLGAMPWGNATFYVLEAIRQHATAADVPGLADCLLTASLDALRKATQSSKRPRP
jgi:hypothetical protein